AGVDRLPASAADPRLLSTPDAPQSFSARTLEAARLAALARAAEALADMARCPYLAAVRAEIRAAWREAANKVAVADDTVAGRATNVLETRSNQSHVVDCGISFAEPDYSDKALLGTRLLGLEELYKRCIRLSIGVWS
ncbi:hypothetical protein HK405_011515, partial [Cladochytrium tenue]